MIKIVKPKAEIIINNDTVLQRIERVGRICYKSEDKITDDSFKFVRKIIASGHHSVLEFGMISINMYCETLTDMYNVRNIAKNESPYIKTLVNHVTPVVTLTASLRVWFELMMANPVFSMTSNIVRHVFSKNEELSVFGNNLRIPCFPEDGRIKSAQIVNPEDVHFSHKQYLVKFTVSRAISHQIVRHRPCSFMQESQRYCRYDKEMTFIEPLWVDNAEKSELFADDCENAFYRYNRRIQQGLKPQEARGCLPQDTKTELYVMADAKEWNHIFSQRCASGADPEIQRVMKPLQREFLDKGWI